MSTLEIRPQEQAKVSFGFMGKGHDFSGSQILSVASFCETSVVLKRFLKVFVGLVLGNPATLRIHCGSHNCSSITINIDNSRNSEEPQMSNKVISEYSYQSVILVPVV